MGNQENKKCVYDELADSMAFADRAAKASKVEKSELRKIEILEDHLPKNPIEPNLVVNEIASQKFRLMMAQVRNRMSEKGVI